MDLIWLFLYEKPFQGNCGSYVCLCVLFVIVFLCMYLIITVCLFLFVAVDLFVPDGSVKNFSGETRNRDRSQRASSDPQLKELCGSHTLEQTVGATHIHTVYLGMSHSVASCK